MNFIFPDSQQIKVLNLLQGTDSIPFADDGTKSRVHLLKSDSVPMAPTTTFADLKSAEADFPGYIQLPVDWNKPQRDGLGSYELSAQVGEWRPSNDTFGGQTIYGIFGTGSGADSATVNWMASLDAPWTLTDSHSALNLDLSLHSGINGLCGTD